MARLWERVTSRRRLDQLGSVLREALEQHGTRKGLSLDTVESCVHTASKRLLRRTVGDLLSGVPAAQEQVCLLTPEHLCVAELHGRKTYVYSAALDSLMVTDYQPEDFEDYGVEVRGRFGRNGDTSLIMLGFEKCEVSESFLERLHATVQHAGS